MLEQMTARLDFHANALLLRSQRQQVIASNIANADTPGYVARDFNFANALADATGRQSQAAGTSAPRVTMTASSPLHMARNGSLAGARSEPELNYATQSQTNLDGNTVDMDRERASFADNTVRYEAALRFINSQIRTLNSAITGQ